MNYGYELYDSRAAILPVVVASATTTTGVVIDATGYRRASFTFTFGAMTDSAATAACSITASTTSGGQYAAITGASIAAGLDGVLGSKSHTIEVDLSSASQGAFLKAVVVTANGSTYSVPMAASVQLYGAASVPVTRQGSSATAVGR